LAAAHKDDLFFKSALGEAFGRKSTMLLTLGDKAGASSAIQAERSVQEDVNGRPQDEKQRRTEDITKLIEDGDRLLDGKNYEKALEKLNTAELAATGLMTDLPLSSADFAMLADIYAKMAELHEKRGETKERLVVLSQSAHADAIASAIDPENDAVMLKLANTRLDVLLLQEANGVFDDTMAANIRQLIAGADSLVRRDRQYLDERGMSKIALGKFMHARDEAGWEETFRSGLVDMDVAMESNKRNSDAPRLAGDMRETLAHDLEEDNRSDEGSEVRRHALKDYEEALKRDPSNSEVREKIQEIKKSGIQ
jgi:tetratricopeptide (TPR) repeat protein